MAASWTGFRQLLLAVVLAAGLPCSAHALEMLIAKMDDGTESLVLRDCKDSQSRKCKEQEKSFYEGDAARLEQVLSKRGFPEVLLISGGGNLDEGVKVGEVLRRYGAAVRVPAGHQCVSACTVAFLGGVIRTVDKEASYEVHAYSGVFDGLRDAARARIVSYPEQELQRLALQERGRALEWAQRLFTYAQRMIGGRPDMAASQRVLQGGRDITPRYIRDGQMQRDVQMVQVEGAAAAHTAVMNIERAAMEDAIELLRPHLSELGPRATPALNILDTMFSSAIIRTAPLTPETLLRMGYVTPIVGR